MRIGVTELVNGNYVTRLRLVDPVPQSQINLSGAEALVKDGAPAWSPDGEWVAYGSRKGEASMLIRKFREADRETIKAITAICFEGVAIDHAIEERYGLVDGKDWRFRKVRHIDNDIAANADGIFVAEIDEAVIGYITTRLDQATKVGSIPNLGVLPAQRGAGIGRQLIETAIAYAKANGMVHLRIETLAHNPIGQYLYPSCGFQEVARQIHYVLPLG